MAVVKLMLVVYRHHNIGINVRISTSSVVKILKITLDLEEVRERSVRLAIVHLEKCAHIHMCSTRLAETGIMADHVYR